MAVLYFDNLSRDTGDAYVAEGLTEELTTRLGQIARLQVKSRTATQRYRDRPTEVPLVMVPLTTHIEAHQITRPQFAVEMVVQHE